MASGCPVIASSIGPILEVVGDAGCLVEPAQVEPLSLALRKIAQEPSYAAELRARGVERAQHFSWQRTAEQTLAVYRDVAR
jgi:glycosyltransferase involved in cell wall biosynthesis